MADHPNTKALHYVRDQLKELARLSRQGGYDTLAYLIEMAVLEADAEWHARK